jgi:hypothetical protein
LRELIDEIADGIVILLIYQPPKPAMYSPAKGLALEEAGKDHVQNKTRAYRCGWGSGSRSGATCRWMQFEHDIIKHAGFERPGGGFERPGGGLKRPGLKRPSGGRDPDGDLLLQPEPLRGRVA